ncbi:MAG: hypothetical protein JRN38_02530 [Nitrososphaerota archaeon]|nr:hypothetical protein [Nitrososphaerota archaeon]
MSAAAKTIKGGIPSSRVDADDDLAENEWIEEVEILRKTAQKTRGSDQMKVSLRPLKYITDGLPVGHPLRILLSGERDDIPLDEYLAKLPGWFRLLKSMD